MPSRMQLIWQKDARQGLSSYVLFIPLLILFIIGNLGSVDLGRFKENE